MDLFLYLMFEMELCQVTHESVLVTDSFAFKSSEFQKKICVFLGHICLK